MSYGVVTFFFCIFLYDVGGGGGAILRVRWNGLFCTTSLDKTCFRQLL